MDDDLEDIVWKCREGNVDSVSSLPCGALEALFFDAHSRMKEVGAFLWGLNTSQNPQSMMTSTVSMRNGLVNGYLHGFLSRPSCKELLRTGPDAVEDAEFSVRNFAKDRVVLRYRMYAGGTRSGSQRRRFAGQVRGGCPS
ncbi:unnamed protein product [Prorocentrum cordatum]|uniref:Uncharacterized protein n=1 Tax=Prorocentrum cordatum TaxID=2364126 RepID=A0ABN9TXZ6_9DINO|nr:unnamed protein product [Polarella glacialis]